MAEVDMSDARRYCVAETLRDGTDVTIRAVRPDDVQRLSNAFAGLERQSVYTRFFALKKALSPAELAHVAEIDFVHEVMLVATIMIAGEEVIVATARYIGQEGSDPFAAEVAFTVEEDYQGRGLAGRLLGHLAALGREHGVGRFIAEVLPENRAMRAVFARAGGTVRERREGGIVHVELDL
jgi:RimJ/RimL family protein N-acetyltransferase